jgi:hypothetical protein
MPRKMRAENKHYGTLWVCVGARLLFTATTRMWVAFWSFHTCLRTRTIMCWTSYCPPGVLGANLRTDPGAARCTRTVCFCSI